MPPWNDSIEAMLMILPLPCAMKWRPAACDMKNADLMLTFITSSQSFSLKSTASARRIRPSAVSPSRPPMEMPMATTTKPITSGAERKLRRHLDCEPSYDEEVYARLKQWRLELARERSMPAFVIFTDATLMAIAEASPGDAAGLLRIPGVGPAKCEQYGPAVLGILAEDQSANPGR